MTASRVRARAFCAPVCLASSRASRSSLQSRPSAAWHVGLRSSAARASSSRSVRGPAGRQADRRRRDRRRPVRLQRGAVGRREHRPDRRPYDDSGNAGRRGCSPARARPGPSRAQADRQRRDRRRQLRLQRGAVGRREHRPDRRPVDNGGTGAAWVFTRSGSTWTQQGGKLTGSGETGDGGFGSSVALSADGNTALIGGPGDNGSTGRGVGVHPLGRRPGRSRARS